ncbi:uncharacterized protein SCHCODRAFT_01340215 [Schizophyllum commune H4-8]|nr:uncharacterized protein SCHCODRAFT_01340215 [Schizophyllum commune H4-8]KAI5887234.1 hypothetical protein SCHCODRAFT_01340215 [Schizophyllum commune H4-8]
MQTIYTAVLTTPNLYIDSSHRSGSRVASGTLRRYTTNNNGGNWRPMPNVPRSITARFAVIAKKKDYSKNTEALAEEYRKKREAFISKGAWKKLCMTMGIGKAYIGSGKLSDVAACKKLMKGMYVNIVDLVDASRAGKTCTPFRSYKALKEYIDEEEKSYLLWAAKDNPLLRRFLVTLSDSPPKSRLPEKAHRRDRRSIQSTIDGVSATPVS